ncbi:unnamed protein product [Oikopleura dioica]|uniref:Uncharacterized protein n=1 Tax=Oikopleura dioica TaxID=34765 RepID=E4Y4H4_OIKDI|nr:unnamed protein product [Oikopleura dioica]
MKSETVNLRDQISSMKREKVRQENKKETFEDLLKRENYKKGKIIGQMKSEASVQNIAKNFRERASASWTFLIFSQASERELDNVFFSPSERASSPARSQARSRSRSPLARACMLASFVALALSLDMKLALYIKLALYMKLARALQLASLLLL